MKDTKCRNCKAMPLRVPFRASALNELLCAIWLLSTMQLNALIS